MAQVAWAAALVTSATVSGPAAAAAAAAAAAGIEAVGVGWVLEEHVRPQVTSETLDGLAAADSLLDVIQWGLRQVGRNYAHGAAVHAAAVRAAVVAVHVAAAAVHAVAAHVHAVAAAVHAVATVAVAELAFEFEFCD